jgi:hypothetical protein
MATGVIRNVQFTRLMKVEGKFREFNFRKMGINSEGQFTVDTADDRGNRIVFAMSKDNDTWKFINTNFPVWISQNETKLHEIIEEELSLLQ